MLCADNAPVFDMGSVSEGTSTMVTWLLKLETWAAKQGMIDSVTTLCMRRVRIWRMVEVLENEGALDDARTSS